MSGRTEMNLYGVELCGLSHRVMLLLEMLGPSHPVAI